MRQGRLKNQPDKSPCLAPEENGLNIEGLGYLPASGDGREASALIGLRNPLGPLGEALLLPLLNFDDVVMERKKPRFRRTNSALA